MASTGFFSASATRPKRVLLSTTALLGLFTLGGPAMGESDPVPKDAPAYFGPTYAQAIAVPTLTPAVPRIVLPRRALLSPLSNLAPPIGTTANAGGVPATIPKLETDPNALGTTGSYQPAGATATATNAFFQSLGTNGRSCFTCHQPASGMSISVSNIVARAAASHADPLFAPVDGSNCPGAVLRGDAFDSAHSLLLTKGLIRVSMPVPLQTNDVHADGTPNPHPVEFTVKGHPRPERLQHRSDLCSGRCRWSAPTRQMVSMYRRPVMSGDLRFMIMVATICRKPRPIR